MKHILLPLVLFAALEVIMVQNCEAERRPDDPTQEKLAKIKAARAAAKPAKAQKMPVLSYQSRERGRFAGEKTLEIMAKQLLDTTGVKGGLIVHLGCGDGKLTAALRARDSFLVHGLDTDVAKVKKARAHIGSLGLYGPVSVDTYDGTHLPYIDNLVNLIVAEDLGGVLMAEVMRVLAPRGVVMIGDEKIVKPWPDTIDEWTHFLHGSDNNALAEDSVVGPPRHMQWLAGPKWTRHHHADKGTYPSIRAVVSSGGRLYYMADETRSSNRAVPSRWFLVGRDGFSGVLLWKKPLQATTFERRLEQVWRTLVADGNRVYTPLGTDQPLSALEGATGTVIRHYEGTEGLQEVIKDGNVLFVVSKQNAILALRADTGQQLWQWSPRQDDALVPLTLAATGGKVFVKTDKEIHCLSANKGKTLWRLALEGAEKKIRLKWPREKLLVKDGVVLCSYGGKDPKVLNLDRFQYLGSHPRVHEYGGKLAALSAEDGSVLWQTDYLPGLESMPGEIYISDGLVWLGPAFAEPRDLHTGAVKNTQGVLERLWTTGHHHRCYPGKATSRYIITAKRGIEMIDLTGENHSRNNWVRATCRVGVTPCNGLLYAPPHSCGCYMEAKLYGFWALAARRSDENGTKAPADKTSVSMVNPAAKPARLQKGPAYGNSGFSQSRMRYSDWWTYRGDPARSGSKTSSVPSDLKQLWTVNIGGRLSAATVADGKVLVAQVDAHTVHARDAETGKALWRFTAGGRVDSPPTLYRGLVLFGSRDGWVYCLRASDGAVVWRFLAAPEQINAVAYEQVESLWPVHGSVLVNNGLVYVAAGRSSYLDGGILLYGLNPETGEVQCKTHLASEHTGALDPPSKDKQSKMSTTIRQNYTDYKTFMAPDRSDAFSMRGALTDVMTAEGESIFMRHIRFDGRLMQQEEKRPHLFSTSSLLDDTEHHRSYWVVGTGDFSRTPVAYPWIVTKSLAVPYGLMLAFDDTTVWGIHRVGSKKDKDGYAVFVTPRPNPLDEKSLLPDFAERSSKKIAGGQSWTVPLAMRPRAMVRANNYLFIGGMPKHIVPKHPSAPGNTASEGKTGGLLHIVSCGDGKTVGRVELESAPVWDGMAAADGRLYLSAIDGTVTCFSGE